MNQQTLIPVSIDNENSFDSFRVGDNAELLAELQCIVHRMRACRVLYFCGESGSGKTHLLNACCQVARTLGKPHVYLPLNELPPDTAQLARILPQCLVCIDDFQTIAASVPWQTELFGLYEKLLGDTGAMVVAGNQPIRALNLGLKDLESRLVSGGVYKLAALNESDKLAALQDRARQKGIELNAQLLQFIITYYRRDTVSLFALLERIDHASLAEQRKITVPFIKSLL